MPMAHVKLQTLGRIQEKNMKKDNPFTLMFGKQPMTYIKRPIEDAQEIIDAFEEENPISQMILISGARGCGKSVLLTSVANQLRQSGKWLVIELNSSQQLITEFTTRLMDAGTLKMSFFSMASMALLAHLGLSYDEKDNIGRVEFMLDALKRNHRRVLVTIDDVMINDDMRNFLNQFQMLVRMNYDVYLVMTGLYENIGGIINDPFLPQNYQVIVNPDEMRKEMYENEDFSYLLRLPKIVLGQLKIADVKAVYQKLLSVEEEQAQKMADLTMGYAFAVQALGMLYWEYHDSASFEQIIGKLDGILTEYVYGPSGVRHQMKKRKSFWQCRSKARQSILKS